MCQRVRPITLVRVHAQMYGCLRARVRACVCVRAGVCTQARAYECVCIVKLKGILTISSAVQQH